MRISEIEQGEESIDQIHNNWLKAVSNSAHPPSKQQKDYVYSRARTNMQANMSAYAAHAAAQTQMSQQIHYDNPANPRPKKDKFVGIPRRQRGGQIGNQNAVKPGGQVRTGADGRQLRHDRWHGSGDPMGRWGKPGGKNAIQQMKDKWKEFQKADGTFGKDVAKGSLLARGAEKAGKGIVAMGDRARAAAKSRFN